MDLSINNQKFLDLMDKTFDYRLLGRFVPALENTEAELVDTINARLELLYQEAKDFAFKKSNYLAKIFKDNDLKHLEKIFVDFKNIFSFLTKDGLFKPQITLDKYQAILNTCIEYPIIC